MTKKLNESDLLTPNLIRKIGSLYKYYCVSLQIRKKRPNLYTQIKIM